MPICHRCKEEVVEFRTLNELSQHIENVHDNPPAPHITHAPEVEPTPAPVEEKVDVGQDAPGPIVLKYEFTGVCQLCNHKIETLDMELEDRLYMVAYCSRCKKKYQTVRVVPLNEMDKVFKK